MGTSSDSDPTPTPVPGVTEEKEVEREDRLGVSEDLRGQEYHHQQEEQGTSLRKGGSGVKKLNTRYRNPFCWVNGVVVPLISLRPLLPSPLPPQESLVLNSVTQRTIIITNFCLVEPT